MNGLDAHARPPEHIRDFYKIFQKKASNAESGARLLDLDGALQQGKARVVRQYDADHLRDVFLRFSTDDVDLDGTWSNEEKVAYEHDDAPGLLIVPNLLPPSVQVALLNRSLHRDLSLSHHMTNVHKFYEVLYPDNLEASDAAPSFFSLTPSNDPVFQPLDPTVHKPMSINSFLNRKLRWMTTGGQYDWTDKVYPDGAPPKFPEDIAHLLQGLFPDMQPEAAIVNLYSPGDTLSMHRDVAEYCSQGLISISIGCDAIFIVGLDAQGDSPPDPIAIRLRSGDAVYMSGPSRFAWHGVPQIVTNTCPEFLQDWPALGENVCKYDHRKGWMATKRVNLNVRQMFDNEGSKG